MKEFVTDAVVLGLEESGDLDYIVYLYSSNLGKIVARVKSARKITSKLIGHLQPLSLVKIRLVEKSGTQIVDAIAIKRFEKSPAAIELLEFVKEMTFESARDHELYIALKKSLEDIRTGKFSYKPLLEILGFAPDYAECHICKNKKVVAFSPREQIFFCARCVSKVPKNEVISI